MQAHPLMKAAYDGKANVVNPLIEQGSNVNEKRHL